MTQAEIFSAVRTELAVLLLPMGVSETDIKLSSSLVDDFGIDSFGLIELADGLERRLHLDRFWMEDWEIEQSVRRSTRYTVESLVAACWQALQAET